MMISALNAFFAYHELKFVVLAALVALLASYTTFSLMGRLYAPASRYPWVIATGIVTGCGSWATYAIALLAFRPGLPVGYDISLTMLAGAVSVLGSTLGFFIARSTDRMALGGAVVGFAIAAMHYVMVSALQMPAQVHHFPLPLVVSFLAGGSFGAAALSRGELSPNLFGRLIGTVFLTAGIGSAYFAGMSALTITPDASIAPPQDTLALVWFSIALTAIVFLIVGIGGVGTLIDEHLREIEAVKRELEDALKLADSASKSKAKFFSTVSHELRTPLNLIAGFCELLSRSGPDRLSEERFREYVSNIVKSSGYLLRIVNDILDIAKFDTGKLELSDDIVDMNQIVKSCMRLVEHQAAAAAISLLPEIEPGLPLLKADERRLRQILLNLLSNAMKFTPRGGQVRILSFRKHGGVVLSVSDTGIGMDRSEIPNALERFGRVDSEFNRTHPGAGLGLPLAQHLVDLHGGRLHIESEPGAGTTVNVTFPASRVVSEQKAASA